MKEFIEEAISQAFEQFSIDGKGKEEEIAEMIFRDLKLLEPASSSSISSTRNELSRLEIINLLKNLKNCKKCNGTGNADYIEHGSYLSCSLCKGTGKDI